LNLLDGSAAGTIANSKALIYGSSGEVNATTLQLSGTSITATAAELNFVDGVTSAIQTQIDSLSNDKMALGTVAVTVAGGKFVIDGTSQQTVELKPSVTYRFDQSDSSNSNHPLRFSTNDNNDPNAPFTTGVTTAGTPGSAGAYTQVKLEQDAPAVLYYYCSNHSGMGGKAVVRMSDLTASRALISDSGGDIAVSGVTTTELDILDGLTATTTELNIMDGVTASTTELNIMDGVTASTTEINILDGVTATTTELNVLDGIPATLTATELGYVDGVTSAIQTQIDGKQATITGAATTIDDADLTASRAVISNASGKVAASTTTSEEIGHVSGVTSAIQTQLDNKQATITGAATTIDDANLTANRAVISNASGKVAVSTVTDTELGHVSGVSSAIQTQIDGKQATITGAATTIDSSDLTASRAVVSNSSGKVAVSAITSTELGYLNDVSGNIQTQLDGKLSTGGGTLTGSLNVGSGNQLFTDTINEATSNSGVTINSVLLKDDTVTADSHFISGGSGSHWEIVKSGTNLIIKNGTTSLMKLDTSGNLTVTGDIITNGTI
jgi:fructose-specific component phosphotransferase system IIB-like protein